MKPRCETVGFEDLKRMIFDTFEKLSHMRYPRTRVETGPQTRDLPVKIVVRTLLLDPPGGAKPRARPGSKGRDLPLKIVVRTLLLDPPGGAKPRANLRADAVPQTRDVSPTKLCPMGFSRNA